MLILINFTNFQLKRRIELVDDLASRISAYMYNEAQAQKSGIKPIHEGILTIEDGELSKFSFNLHLLHSPRCISIFSFNKSAVSVRYWCVLKSNTLSCYDTTDHTNNFLTLPLNGLKFRFEKEGDDFDSSKRRIVLFKPDGGSVHEDYQIIKFSCANIADIHSWMKHLSRVIVSFELF